MPPTRIETLDHAPLRRSIPSPSGWRATLGQRDGESLSVAAGAIVLAAGGRCFAEAKRLGTFSTNAAGATGEVTEIALAAGCEARDLDALQYHPNGGLWPTSLQGYSIPETTRAYGAVLLNAHGERFVDELGGRDVVAAAIVRECEEGRGLTTPEGRPSVLLDCRPIAVADAEISLPYMLKRYRAAGIDPLAEPIHTYPGAALPERRPRDRRARRHDARGPLRRRRDRGRRARPQPHDGQLAARRLGLRLARGPRAAARQLLARSTPSPAYQSAD